MSKLPLQGFSLLDVTFWPLSAPNSAGVVAIARFSMEANNGINGTSMEHPRNIPDHPYWKIISRWFLDDSPRKNQSDRFPDFPAFKNFATVLIPCIPNDKIPRCSPSRTAKPFIFPFLLLQSLPTGTIPLVKFNIIITKITMFMAGISHPQMVINGSCKNYCLAHFFWTNPEPRGRRPAPATPGHGLFMACSFRPLYLPFMETLMDMISSLLYTAMIWKPPNWNPQISSPITGSFDLYSSVVSLRGGIVQRCDSWAVAVAVHLRIYIFSKE